MMKNYSSFSFHIKIYFKFLIMILSHCWKIQTSIVVIQISLYQIGLFTFWLTLTVFTAVVIMSSCFVHLVVKSIIFIPIFSILDTWRPWKYFCNFSNTFVFSHFKNSYLIFWLYLWGALTSYHSFLRARRRDIASKTRVMLLTTACLFTVRFI